MTNFEKLFSNRELLVELLSEETPFWNYATAWWCEDHCPHRAGNGICTHDECIDTHTTSELIEMWLDAEYEE